MATRKLTNEIREKILNYAAWKELSEEFQWTEQMLEKHKNNVDWQAISGNNKIVWTPAMLERFKKLIDWHELSRTNCETILTEECLERFKDYWDWSKLSDNSSLPLEYPLLDKFIERWDWSALIDRWNDKENYSIDFLERYADNIPSTRLQKSKLWNKVVEERAKELKLEIIA